MAGQLTAKKDIVAPAATTTEGFGLLEMLTPGSWINANFNVWIGAPEDNRSWDYLHAARDFYAQAAANASEKKRKLAFEEFLIAEGSDWNWWYGPEHHSANDRDFDDLYRKHLSNVYQALGAAPPDYLAQPIGIPVGRPSFLPATAYIRPRLSTPYARYFDWIGAAAYTADRRAGAMHGRQFLLDSVYAGIDEGNVYARLDFADDLPSGSLDIVVNCESTNIAMQQPSELRLEVALKNGVLDSWKARLPEEQPATGVPHRDRTIAGSAQRRHRDIEIRIRSRSFEFRLPFNLLGASIGSNLRLRFSVWRDRLPLDALPIEGWIELAVTTEEELEANVYNYGVDN